MKQQLKMLTSVLCILLRFSVVTVSCSLGSVPLVVLEQLRSDLQKFLCTSGIFYSSSKNRFLQTLPCYVVVEKLDRLLVYPMLPSSSNADKLF